MLFLHSLPSTGMADTCFCGQFLHGVWEYDLWSLCLCNKCFTYRPSPRPKKFIYFEEQITSNNIRFIVHCKTSNVMVSVLFVFSYLSQQWSFKLSVLQPSKPSYWVAHPAFVLKQSDHGVLAPTTTRQYSILLDLQLL